MIKEMEDMEGEVRENLCVSKTSLFIQRPVFKKALDCLFLFLPE